ncbi:hypothetical protein SVIOM342S_07946 [Streptomyces violaceorubidus]
MSTAFEGDLTNASASTLAVQRFLAQSLGLGLQTGKQRSVVIAPQRTPTGSQARAMAEGLRALQSGTWSQSQKLTEASAAKPDPDATTKIPGTSSYPSALRGAARSAFVESARTQDALDSFKVVLSDPSRVVTPFGRALNREMSVSWRGRAAEAQSFRAGVKSYLDGLRRPGQTDRQVGDEALRPQRHDPGHGPEQPRAGRGASGPAAHLDESDPSRDDGADYEEQPISVSGGHSQSVKFTTSANANGRATVIAQLYTKDGRPYGEPVTFDVKVTEITATVMLVIGGGVLLLVLAGFRMYTQRKRAAARAAEKGEDGDSDEPEAWTTPRTARRTRRGPRGVSGRSPRHRPGQATRAAE